jgi:PAS domain S-box-containing protein
MSSSPESSLSLSGREYRREPDRHDAVQRLAYIQWDCEFRVVDWSDAAEQIFGYTAEEARGLRGADLVPADVHEHVQAVWSEQLSESGGYFSRNANVTRDGRVIVCEWYNTPRVDAEGAFAGVTSLAKDVTDQERAAQSLRESKVFAENLIATMHDGVSVVDADRVTMQVNDAFCRMTGFAREDLMGTAPPYPYWPPEEYDALRVALREMMAPPGEETGERRSAEWELVYVRRDGTRFPVLVSPATVRDAHGAVTAYLATIKDITERKQAEAELKRAKDVAEEMNRLKSAFLANMSHEIRTPLTGILGFADVIEESALASGGDRDPTVKFARMIKRGGRRLLNTLSTLLDFSRLEAGVMRLKPGWADVVAEVDAAVRRHRSAARDGGITLRTEMPDDTVGMEVDVAALRNVLDNLIDNAIRFTPPGGRVTVRVRRPPPSGEPRGVVLEVVDTGIGIDRAFLDRVFEPFEQESTGHARSHEGSGLGLAVTYHLVRLMNGTISIDSTKGEGTRVVVELGGTD